MSKPLTGVQGGLHKAALASNQVLRTIGGLHKAQA